MRPLTFTRPKVMLPIAGKPILEHLLMEVSAAGIKEFVLVVGYRDEQVRSYFADGAKWGVKISYCQQTRQLGTAHALKQLENQLEGNFLVMNGIYWLSQLIFLLWPQVPKLLLVCLRYQTQAVWECLKQTGTE
jgi:NDP-sugar pyrophosphorylase family protein